MGKRHQARELALRVLFQLESSHDDPDEVLRYHAGEGAASQDVATFAGQLVHGPGEVLGRPPAPAGREHDAEAVGGRVGEGDDPLGAAPQLDRVGQGSLAGDVEYRVDPVRGEGTDPPGEPRPVHRRDGAERAHPLLIGLGRGTDDRGAAHGQALRVVPKNARPCAVVSRKRSRDGVKAAASSATAASAASSPSITVRYA